MAFWNKGDDPWNRKPDKPRTEPKAPQAIPLDSLKAWNEKRKAAAKEKEDAKRLPPESCPWCGKEMEQGFFADGRDGVHWYPGIYKTDLLRGLDSTGRIDVLDEGSTWSGRYKTVWLCRDCKKAIFHMPDPPEVFESMAPQSEAEETKEEETSED